MFKHSLKWLLVILVIGQNLNPSFATETKVASISGSKSSAKTINWQPWSDEAFVRAKNEKKLVLLDLHAVWCHWCHVMDNVTYSNPNVINLIEKNFIAVSVDQDSRPDLSVRYQDYGWPATVIYNSEGKERKILSGYYSPEEFLPILQDCVKSPNKITAVTATRTKPTINADSPNSLSEKIQQELTKRLVEYYDTKNGGWTDGHKFLPAENLEYAMILAYGGDKQSQKQAKEVLDLQKKLLDPVWGGMYQYSTDNDWVHPHYEKIMSIQADNLRMYSLAYLLFNDASYLQTAEKVYDFLSNFLLAPEGAFYTSQDADLIQGKHSHDYFALNDQGRRKLGIPRIDKHIYSRENGWAIEALAYLYMANSNQKCLDTAEKAAQWIVAHRQSNGKYPGAFIHDEQSEQTGQIYLGDNLSMAKAFLALHAVTGKRDWFDKAANLAEVLRKNFTTSAGFSTLKSTHTASDIVDVDENIAAARFFNLLSHYSGKKEDTDSARLAMRYLSVPEIALERYRLVGGFLTANQELSNDPFHVTVVGSYNDPKAAELFVACQKYPLVYRQTEWFDRIQGPLPNPSVDYPELDKAAAFICTGETCSSPKYTLEEVQHMVSKSNKVLHGE